MQKQMHYLVLCHILVGAEAEAHAVLKLNMCQLIASLMLV